MDISTLTVSIGADTSGLMDGVDQVSSMLKNLAPVIQKLSFMKVNIPRSSIDTIGQVQNETTKAKEAMYAFNEVKLDSQKEELASLKKEMQALIDTGQYSTKEFADLKKKI